MDANTERGRRQAERSEMIMVLPRVAGKGWTDLKIGRVSRSSFVKLSKTWNLKLSHLRHFLLKSFFKLKRH